MIFICGFFIFENDLVPFRLGESTLLANCHQFGNFRPFNGEPLWLGGRALENKCKDKKIPGSYPSPDQAKQNKNLSISQKCLIIYVDIVPYT
jgi:hypothetical protein